MRGASPRMTSPTLLRPRLCSAPRREERRAALRPGHETRNSALIIQPSAQFLERNHDVLAKCLVLLQRAVPAFPLRQFRTLDLKFEVSIERGADRYVGQGQRVSQ